MKFTGSHEWVLVSGTIGTVGITNHAQRELGEIVYVELPTLGKIVNRGAEAAVLESTKAAADVYTPVSGAIICVNERLQQEPDLVNSSPEEQGWLFKIQLAFPDELEALLDESAYAKLVGGVSLTERK